MRGGVVTRLLEQAFQEASQLPELEQNVLAKWLLAELHGEEKWDKVFADSEELLGQLADEALAEKRKGKAVPLDLDRL